MATLRVRFIRRTGPKEFDTECVLTTYIVGKRMTNKWLREHYGADTDYKEIFLCHANPYGIKWLITQESPRFGIHFDICQNPEQMETPLPYYDYITYSRT